MEQSRIDRINALARKARAEGLTDEETRERDVLRREYVESVRRNLTAQLENTWVVDEHGNRRKLTRREAERNRRAAQCCTPVFSAKEINVSQQRQLDTEEQGNKDAEFPFPRLVVRRAHPQQGSRRAAEGGEEQQRGLGDAPAALDGPALVETHNQEGGCID